MKPLLATLACITLALFGSCSSLEYDLRSVPIPISAQPVDDATAAEAVPFEIEAKSVLWVHGLFGESNPEVADLVTEASAGYDRIAGFRVRVGASFHDWLATHLSATLVRMKSVVIEGQLVRDR